MNVTYDRETVVDDFASEAHFDSRDVQFAIADLESEIDNLETEDEELSEDDEALLEIYKENLEELIDLREAASSEWQYGVGFIADDSFEEYAREYASDTGACNASSGNWPYNHIDWEAAANELKMDFTPVELGGETFWFRS